MYPAERGKKGIGHWLGPDAEIIHDKQFEQAVERIHAGENFNDLSPAQKRALSAFKVPTGGVTRAALASDGSDVSERNFLSVILDNVETQYEQNQASTGGIRPIRHILRVAE